MKTTIKLVILMALTPFLFSACADDYLNTIPTASTSTETVFQDTKAAKMAVNGMARLMVNQYNGFSQVFCGEGTIKFICGEYMGENFSRPNMSSGSYDLMNGSLLDRNTSNYIKFPWSYYYMLIGNANMIIANIDNAAGEEAERKFIKAQALSYRAYCYAQLVQFYCYRWADSNEGTSVTNLQDGLIYRTEENMDVKDIALVSSGEIYKLIYADLDQAINLFSESGIKRNDVWEPNINVAFAIYARAAITKQDYSKARDMANKARAGYPLMNNAEYTSGFSKDNEEWIWGSYGGDEQTLHFYGFHSYMAYDANTSVVRSYPVCMSKTLYERIPSTDIRKKMFLDPGDNSYSQTVGTVNKEFAEIVRSEHPTMLKSHQVAAYHSFKFSIGGSIGVGYINHFRSSEMLLIEAEASYFSGDEAEAQKLLNQLTRDSKRDEAYNCTATGEDLLKEIKFYRAVELWGEGFDWLDKKRYNEPIVRLSFKDGGNFGSSTAVKREVDYKNKWTYVTPLVESENNNEL